MNDLSDPSTTFTQDGACDSDPGAPVVCTLREALVEAASGATITFSLGGSINLSSTLTIATGVTIDGGGQTVSLGGFSEDVRLTSGSSTFKNLTFTGFNTSVGAVVVETGASLALDGVTFKSNAAFVPGAAVAVSNWGGMLTITNSTFSANNFTGESAGSGIGVVNTSGGATTITNSTFSGSSFGFASSPKAVIMNVAPGTTAVYNTIIANSTSVSNCAASVTGSHNISSDATCPGTQSTNPLLETLANNGGVTETFTLQSGSPAINAGDAGRCPTLDQRGAARVGVCDIGATEHSGVVKVNTTTTLTTSAATAIAGQPVTLTANVASVTTGTPTGTVAFKASGSTIGTATLNGAGQAVLATSSVGLGPNTVAAEYSGDASFNASTSAGVSVHVRYTTAITLTSDVNPSEYSGQVSFTAQATSSSGFAPAGSVTFNIATLTATASLDGSGRAVYTSATSGADVLPFGTHTVTATFAQTDFYATSTATLSQTVSNRTFPGISVTSPRPPLGDWVTLTAQVGYFSDFVPTGFVTIKEGGATIATLPLDGAARAEYGSSSFSQGPHTFTVEYSGDSRFRGGVGQSPVQTSVIAYDALTALSASPVSVTYGQTITYQAHVTSALSARIPTGSITIPGALNSVALDSTGRATVSAPATGLGIGETFVNAVYVDDDYFAAAFPPSNYVSVTVSPAQTTTTLTASPGGASTFGVPVVLTATVVNAGAPSVQPVGSVEFYDGSTLLGTGFIGGGQATWSFPGDGSLRGGVHEFRAVYVPYVVPGSVSPHLASTSATLSYTVNRLATGVTFSAIGIRNVPNPSSNVPGLEIRFSAVPLNEGGSRFVPVGIGNPPVLGPPPGALPFPNGTIAFKDNGVVFERRSLGYFNTGLEATFTREVLSGVHLFTAEYEGDQNYAASTAPTSYPFEFTRESTSMTLIGPSSATYGDTITLAAQVNGAAHAGGTYAFTSAPVYFQDRTSGIVALGSSATSFGSAQITTQLTDVATRTYLASFEGDGRYNASMAVLTLPVNRATPTLDFAIVSTTVNLGTPFSLKVTARAQGGAAGLGAPGGSVQLYRGSRLVSEASLSSSGEVQLSDTPTAIGTYKYSVQYLGDERFVPVSREWDGTVVKLAAGLTLQALPTTTKFGERSTFVVTLSGTGGVRPTGSIVFKRLGSEELLGTADLVAATSSPPQTNALRQISFYAAPSVAGSAAAAPSYAEETASTASTARLDIGAWLPGRYDVTIDYSGDANYQLARVGTVSHTIEKGTPRVVLTTDRGAIGQYTFGERPTFRAEAQTPRGEPLAGVVQLSRARPNGFEPYRSFPRSERGEPVELPWNEATGGQHQFRATFVPDRPDTMERYTNADSTMVQVIVQARPTSLSLRRAGRTLFSGDPVALEVDVTDMDGTIIPGAFDISVTDQFSTCESKTAVAGFFCSFTPTFGRTQLVVRFAGNESLLGAVRVFDINVERKTPVVRISSPPSSAWSLAGGGEVSWEVLGPDLQPLTLGITRLIVNGGGHSCADVDGDVGPSGTCQVGFNRPGDASVTASFSGSAHYEAATASVAKRVLQCFRLDVPSIFEPELQLPPSPECYFGPRTETDPLLYLERSSVLMTLTAPPLQSWLPSQLEETLQVERIMTENHFVQPQLYPRCFPLFVQPNPQQALPPPLVQRMPGMYVGGRVTATPEPNCQYSGEPLYRAGTVVRLTHTLLSESVLGPGLAGEFVGWALDASGTAAQVQVVMDRPRAVAALTQLPCVRMEIQHTLGGSMRVLPQPDCDLAAGGRGWSRGTRLFLYARPDDGFWVESWDEGERNDIETTQSVSGGEILRVYSQVLTNDVVRVDFRRCFRLDAHMGSLTNRVTVQPAPNCRLNMVGGAWYEPNTDVTVSTPSSFPSFTMFGDPAIAQFLRWNLSDEEGVTLASVGGLNTLRFQMDRHREAQSFYYTPADRLCHILSVVIPPGSGGTVRQDPPERERLCPPGQASDGVKLTAVPAPGRAFSGWTVNIEPRIDRQTGRITLPEQNYFESGTELYIMMDERVQVQAHFFDCFTVARHFQTTSPAGQLRSEYVPNNATDGRMTISPPPNCPDARIAGWREGTQISIVANSPARGTQGTEGFVFTGWTGDVENASRGVTFPITRNVDMVAAYTITCYELRLGTHVSADEPNCPDAPAGTRRYIAGTRVPVRAADRSGYDFDGWEGPVQEVRGVHFVEVTRDLTVGADYDERSIWDEAGSAISGAFETAASPFVSAANVIAEEFPTAEEWKEAAVFMASTSLQTIVNVVSPFSIIQGIGGAIGAIGALAGEEDMESVGQDIEQSGRFMNSALNCMLGATNPMTATIAELTATVYNVGSAAYNISGTIGAVQSARAAGETGTAVAQGINASTQVGQMVGFAGRIGTATAAGVTRGPGAARDVMMPPRFQNTQTPMQCMEAQAPRYIRGSDGRVTNVF